MSDDFRGDIHNQSRTLQKIDRNFACFLPPIFFRGETPKFLEFSASFNPDSDTWQSFAEIGQGTSEIWLPKKTSRVKHKPVRNGGSGRLIT